MATHLHHMKWIDAGDIKNWASGNQRHCQQTLPELLRRLILAHAGNAVDEFDFASGDSISTSEWDGRLNTPVVSPFFPSGISGWEISAKKSAQRKANEDYQKRTMKPLGLRRKQSTFVFVTPRSWPGRGKWEREKGTRKWKAVRVINADGLEAWLDSTPAVSLWLARQIGKVVSGGIRDLESFWEEWSVATNPVMTPDLVIGGRTKDAEQIKNWIAQKPTILEVQGDRPDEAFAFLYAAIATLPGIERTKSVARCVLVENIHEFRQLTQAFQNNPLIIVAPGECIDAASMAITKGHHVFVSMDAKVIGIRDIFRLSRPQLSAVEQILHSSGLSEVEAQRLALDSGHSIPVLRRHLSQSRAVSAPTWANTESARILIPALLAGAWNEAQDGDRQVIKSLSGTSNAAFVTDLMPFLSIDDSPIRRVGGVWMIKSPLDAWFLLAPHLTDSFLASFQKSILAVLTETDPKYDLAPELRWAAAAYGKASPYSEWLRTGLVESLVLLAVFGNRFVSMSSTQAVANKTVRDVFDNASNWETWASLQDVTPLLAEAAPNTFMEVVEQGIVKNPDVFRELMHDDGGIFGECRHCGLLFALEGIAWSSEYFSRAVSVLGQLANLDPGGKWGNRPINSLRDIFLPRFPQTYASAEERLVALDGLVAKYPELVWQFARSYYGGGGISESHRFRWRDAGGIRRGLEQEDNASFKKYLTGLLPRLGNLACARVNIIASAADLIHFPSEISERLLTELEEIDRATFSKEERSKLLESIRGAMNWITNYGDESKRAQLPILGRVLEKFAPDDIFERFGWLLNNPWPILPIAKSSEPESNEIAIRRAQEEAARNVLDAAPLEKILEFARTTKYPGITGYALGKVVRDEHEDSNVLDAMLGHLDEPTLVKGYAGGRVEIEGTSWIDKQISRLRTEGKYSPEMCALLYFGLPENEQTWSVVSAHGTDVENAYWKHARGYAQKGNEAAQFAVGKLLDAKRPHVALYVAGDPHVSISSSLLKRLIQELLTLDPGERRFGADAMYIFHLGNVFKQIYERKELPIEEIAKLEWPFALLFQDLRRYTSSPMALHRALQKDPSFFAQLISVTYKRDDHAPDPEYAGVNNETMATHGTLARAVLDAWRLVPGLKDDGTMDEHELIDWVDSARRKCADIGHVIGGDLQIAAILARAPADIDGTWPHIAVRNLIEKLNSEIIEKHIPTEIYNNRRAVSRGINDGGAQERELEDNYRKLSATVKTKWPRTAAMLRSIAESYADDAKREDVYADLRELRWE